jgi:hypothetical protein
MSVTIDGSTSVTINSGAVLGITSGTAVASTSGTSIDFTSIPSWVKRITVMMRGLSTNGSSNPQIQIGGGSIETSGYTGAAWSANTVNVAFSSGFVVSANTSSTVVIDAVVVISNISGNIWMAAVNGGRTDSAAALAGGGSKSLSATLDRLRLTTVNGTDTFDAGSINILYE